MDKLNKCFYMRKNILQSLNFAGSSLPYSELTEPHFGLSTLLQEPSKVLYLRSPIHSSGPVPHSLQDAFRTNAPRNTNKITILNISCYPDAHKLGRKNSCVVNETH